MAVAPSTDLSVLPTRTPVILGAGGSATQVQEPSGTPGSTISVPDTSVPTTLAGEQTGVSPNVVVAVSISVSLAVLFTLIGIFIFLRRRWVRRHADTSPIPPSSMQPSMTPSKSETVYANLTAPTGKVPSTPPQEPSRPAGLGSNIHVEENEQALRDLRDAMQTSGFTVNTLFARLAGPRAHRISDSSEQGTTLPAYQDER